MKSTTKYCSLLPGFVTAVAIAFVARWLEGLMPVHLIGASVIALFIGMFLNPYMSSPTFKLGLKFTSKKVLKFAIVLLGASLNVATILTVGKLSLSVMCFTLLTCFGGGYFVGKFFGLNWKMSNLISAGTGICGGSAVAAIAPVIDAEDTDIAFAMSATFLFDMAMIVAFPIMGKALGLSDMAYGLWAGTAVNDTSSVVAAGYAFSEAAGDFATMVKLTRTLAIIPTVLIFAAINVHLKKKAAAAQGDVEGGKVSVWNLFPWFILFFVIMSLLNNVGLFTPAFSHTAKDLSKFLMVCALAAIGLNTSFKEMRKAGPAPMLHGFVISLLVVVVAITVEWCMGLF